jgi:hypothetical protein
MTTIDLRDRTPDDLHKWHHATHQHRDANATLAHAAARHELRRRGLPVTCPPSWSGDVALKMEHHSETDGDQARTVVINGQEVTVGDGETLTLTESGQMIVVPAQRDTEQETEMGMAKAVDQKRYTLSAWYIPDQTDAHGEWTDPDELQQAAWRYVRNGDRNIRLQHNTDIVAGEWVEIISWPFQVTAPKTDPDTGDTVDKAYPAGTVFLGVVWCEWAWDLVIQGKLRGLSIGGTAWRVDTEQEQNSNSQEKE